MFASAKILPASRRDTLQIIGKKVYEMGILHANNESTAPEKSGNRRSSVKAPIAKSYRIGTHRIVPPETTFETVYPHFNSFGVTRLADVTGLDRVGIPVVMAIRPMSRSISVHQGKGSTLAAAKVSAAMEATESWHAQNILLPQCRASPVEVSSDVYAGSCLTSFGCEAFNESTNPIHWLKGNDLVLGSETWIPRQLIQTDFVDDPELPKLPSSSNGLASGNSLDEAICAALCEVIERDCVASFHRLRPSEQAHFRIRRDSVDDDHCNMLIDRIEHSGIQIQMWDITSDVGIPAFCCRVFEYHDDRRPEAKANLGHGCHLDPAVALARAVTEAVQARLTIIAGVRDDIQPDDYVAASGANERLMMEDAYFCGMEGADFSALRDRSTDTLEEDREILLRRLARAGLKHVVAVDLTQEEFGIPVVRVVVPQLGWYSRERSFVARRRHIAVTEPGA